MLGKLTTKFIAALPSAPARKQYIAWDQGDGSVKGFGIRVTANAKSFVVERRIRHRTARLTIGRADSWHVEQARSHARKLIVAIDSGLDPRVEDKKSLEASKTLRQAFEEFLAERKKLQPRTVSNYRRYMARYFATLANTPVIDVTYDKLSEIYIRIADSTAGPTQANISFRMLRAVFRSNCPANPLNPVWYLSTKKGIWRAEVPRKDHVRLGDLGKFLAALDVWGDSMTRFYVEFLLRTGCRQSSARALKWADIDFANDEIAMVNKKNRRQSPRYPFPLTPDMRKLLSRIRNISTGSNPFVFGVRSSVGAHTSVVDARKCLRFVNAAAKTHVTFHGLRRTFITAIANDVGAPPPVYKRLAGHSLNGDVTEVFYRQLSTNDLQKWVLRYEELLAQKQTEAVAATRC